MSVDPTTPESRAELRRLLGSGFTDQPWAIWYDLDHQGFTTIGDEAGVLTDEKPFTEECNPFAHVYTDDLAVLIVSAVNALPKLLDALDQTEKNNSELFDASLRYKHRANEFRTEARFQQARAEKSEAALDRVRELLVLNGRPRFGTVPSSLIREALGES